MINILFEMELSPGKTSEAKLFYITFFPPVKLLH